VDYKDLQYVLLQIRDNTEDSAKMTREQLQFKCKIIHSLTKNAFEESKKSGLGYTDKDL
jgi:hypothetical protein